LLCGLLRYTNVRSYTAGHRYMVLNMKLFVIKILDVLLAFLMALLLYFFNKVIGLVILNFILFRSIFRFLSITYKERILLFFKLHFFMVILQWEDIFCSRRNFFFVDFSWSLRAQHTYWQNQFGQGCIFEPGKNAHYFWVSGNLDCFTPH